MKGIKVCTPPGRAAPVAQFIDNLEPRLREKLIRQLIELPGTPRSALREPHFKHFTLERYFKEHGHYVKAVNFLDMAHSDGWNCLYGLDKEPQLAQTVANTIIQNTSGPREADDFWSRAELNLLMALIHYVVNLKDAKGNLLPIEKREIGRAHV